MTVPGHGWSTLNRTERVAFLSQYVNTIQEGPYWPTTALTFSFPQALFSSPSYVPNGEAVGYAPFTEAEKSFVREMLSYLSSFTGLTFTETTGPASLEYGKHNMTAGGYASAPPEGDIYISSSAPTSSPGDYGLNTIVHETLHALGFKHPGNYSFDGFQETGPFLPFELDSGMTTNLTYQDYLYNDEYTQTVRPLDVFALQAAYGISADASSTNFRFLNDATLSFAREAGGWAIGTSSPFLVVDTGGYDRLDFSAWDASSVNCDFALSLDLTAGGGTIDSDNPRGFISDFFSSSYVDIDPATDRLFNVEIYDQSVIEEVVGTRFADRLVGDATLARFVGGDGNDVYIARLADAGVLTEFVGGAGFDRIEYDVVRSALAVDLRDDGSIAVSTAQGMIDRLVTIEKIAFSNGALIYELGAIAPAAYRLYGGAFDRTPDEGGLRFWANDWLGSGRSMHDAAAEFIRSAEFIQRYGSSVSDTAYVDQLYQNVLHRAGEADGVQFWNNFLAGQSGDRADALVNFTQLPEYVANSSANIDDGFWVV